MLWVHRTGENHARPDSHGGKIIGAGYGSHQNLIDAMA